MEFNVNVTFCVKLTTICLIGFIFINNVDAKSHICTTQTSYSHKYSIKCWVFGWSRCTKHKTKYRSTQFCCSGWRSAGSGLRCDRAICGGKIDPGACNKNFPNSHIIRSDGTKKTSSGGVCDIPDKCTCNEEGFYSAGPFCDICSAILNCNQEVCETKSDQTCARCNGTTGPGVGEQAYVVSGNRTSCIQACSWRSDSTRCYPGLCASQYASNCRCTSGFTGKHCDIITAKPVIRENALRLTAANGNVIDAPPNWNHGPSQATVWTNIVNPKSIYYKFTADFIKTVPDRHAFITDFKVGIIGGSIDLNRQTHDGTLISTLNQMCYSPNSRSNLEQTVVTCEDTFTSLSSLSLPFSHTDIFNFNMTASNGGFVKVHNLETGIVETQYYTGTSQSHEFSIGFDTENPTHCQITSNCDLVMMKDIDTTTQGTQAITWDGWSDLDSGIKDYHLEGFELQIFGDELETQGSFTRLTSTSQSITVTFPKTGVYALLLSVNDNAGNYISARRILIYDSGSSITVTTKSSLRITSASEETNFMWQNTMDSVSINWSNRYINTVHHNGRFLAAVKLYSNISSDYDDNNGTRTTQAINNVQGIVKFETAYEIDHNGGTTITNLERNYEYTGNLNQFDTITPSVRDGDTLIYFIRAFDVMSQYKEESVTVHFDSSPPIIENLWLTKGDELNIAVHGFEHIDKMIIEWVAFDDHSGLESVQWRLYDKLTEIEHGSQHIPPQGETATLTECQSKYGSYPRGHNCYCTPGGKCFHRHFQVKPTLTNTQGEGILNNKNTGIHDHDYHITVTVINIAKLSTTLTYQITIDTSPPHGGSVHDGQYGRPEVDFQTDNQLFAHWEGFFDRESGVKFYQYGFDSSCVDASKFSLNLGGRRDVLQTTSTQASWTAPSAGKYFITVVAYNRALEASRPVCSDGVTIDSTVPVVGEIDIEGARIKGGLVKISELNQVFYITDTRRRYLLDKSDNLLDSSCRNKILAVPFSRIILFPLERFPNGSVMIRSSAEFCNEQKLDLTFSHTSYLSQHSHIYVNWTGADEESGIYDYEFGLASDKESVSAPDLLPFTSTNHHAWYKGYHPRLSEGTEFFISIKAINKAGKTIIQSLGPILVHTMPPAFNGEVDVSYVNDQLQIEWANGKLTDPEPSHLQLTIAIGSKPGSQDILPFSSTASVGRPCLGDVVSCRTFSSRDLHWDLHHTFTYYVSIRIENIVGLYSTYTSKPYIHNTRLPTRGIVYEVVQPDEEEDFKISKVQDSDFQLSKTKISARWFGFESNELAHDITYKVGIGASSGATDITEVSVGGGTSHTFQGLNLLLHTTYYVSVTATSDAGTISVTSNGLTIVEKDTDLENQVSVKDGPGCNLQGDKFIWKPNHNDNIETARQVCKDDSDYQVSTSIYMTHWTINEDIQHLYPDIKWNLQVKQENTDDLWNNVLERHSLLNSGRHLESVELHHCKAYRSSVRFCSGEVCSKPAVSSGVIILSEPGKPQMQIIHKKQQNSMLEVLLSFAVSNQKDLCAVESTIDKYEWSLSDNKHNTHLLTKWKQVTQVQNLGNSQFQFNVDLDGELDFSECRRLAVRIFNKAGLSTTISSDIKNCSAVDPILIKPSIVIDAVEESNGKDSNTNPEGSGITLEQNDMWIKEDVDYTPYKNIISAVWPSLRHRHYVWGLIEEYSLGTVTHFTRQEQIIKDLCSHPSTIICGKTDKEYINIYPMEKLVHGRRYHVCIYADAKTTIHEKWVEDLPEINECSDGVTVDLAPPTGGRVWVDNLRHAKYQISSNDVTVYWDSFVDVEKNSATAVHPSGISQYYLSLGSSSDGGDILAKDNVGLVNHKVLHHLSLQNGHTYFITVQATDFVNRSTIVYSDGFVVDNTMPEITSKPIQFPSSYITSNNLLSVCWSGSFIDNESGIYLYKWAVGSRPGHQDVMKFIQTSNDCDESELDPGLKDGYSYYVTVEAINGAGLTATLVSRPVTVDSTSPIGGHVLDLMSNEPTSDDIDYITDESKLVVRWQGFHDPHSSMKYYKIKLGTCSGCDDVVSEVEAGASREFAFHQIKLIPGRRYITTVTGCNMADLCTAVSSDGILLDITPPVAGRVLDGTKDLDIEYQATRNYVGAKWYSFKDSESGIARYEWRVGITKGGDELFRAEELPIIELVYKSNIPENKQLPVGTKIYITIRAYNKAGLFREATSNGFMIDITLPEIAKVATLSSTFASLKPSTTISRTSIKVEWEFKDEESDIARQYISVSPHLLGDFNSSAMEIPSVLTEYIFFNMDLHDGSIYNIKIIGCNLAGLCRSSITNDVTVDSSPPTTGMFAIQTDHAARLNRPGYEWIKWTTNSINMAWLGFADLHTGINKYIVSVGTKPFLRDLNKENTEAVFDHVKGSDFGDEGMVQTFTIETQPLTIGTRVFIAIWAVNGVGLKSLPAHSEFELGEGSLDLMRRCQPYNCAGHCVCAAQNMKCAADNSCTDVSQGNTNYIVQVFDVLDLTSEFEHQISYTSTNSFVAAKWSISTVQGLPVKRYEISAGESGEPTPVGIFDTATERVWFDVGENTNAVITLPKDKALQDSLKYSVFIRAWYDNNNYAVFKSPGITLIPSPPTVTYIAGAAIKELTTTSSDNDIDFQTSTNQIIIGWKNKFRGGIHELQFFKPYISTHPQGHNIHQTSDNIPVNESTYKTTSLNLEENRVYYSTVLVYNKANLVSWSSSDGIVIDKTSPLSGIVHDGNDIEDSDYQSSLNGLSASWYGFSDMDSGIVQYYWCVGTTGDTTDCSVQSWTNVGLKTQINIKTTTPLTSGVKLYHKVYAEDGIGLRSPVSVSDGIIVDNTPPLQVDIEYVSENIILNPSFEEGGIASDNECDDHIPSNWNTNSTSCIKTVQSNPTVTKQGDTYVKVTGEIRQSVLLELRKVYQLTVHVGYPHDLTSQHHAVEGFVKLGKEIYTFKLIPELCQGMCNIKEQPLIIWYKYTYIVHSSHTSDEIVIGTTTNKMILAVDDIHLREINYIDVSSESNHLVYHTVFRPFWSSVHLNWHFKDDESPITDYRWALGSVKGGTQIREFSSVGKRQHVTVTDLQLAHNTLLYLTIMCTNGAGLTTVSLSDSIIVDMTPPVILQINDGLGQDVKFQLTRVISVNWIIEDKESGMDYCEWAIGSTKGNVDIRPFNPVSTGESSATVELDANIVGNSRQVYSTVRCYNKAGLPSTASTDGVIIILQVVDKSGQFSVDKDSTAQYPVTGQCHPKDVSLRLQWNFENEIDTRSIQVSVIGESSRLDKEVRVHDLNYNQAGLIKLNLQARSYYNISLSTINILGRQDGSISTHITIQGQPPNLNGKSSILIAKSFDGKSAQISWSNLFESVWNDLYYEVSLGTYAGGANILQWQETKKPTLYVTLPDKVKTRTLYLTLTAIDPCGLFMHYNQAINI